SCARRHTRSRRDWSSDVCSSDLRAAYDAVVLCCGASNPRDLNVPGGEAEGIYFAVDFLRSTTKSLLDSGLKDGNFISAAGKRVQIGRATCREIDERTVGRAAWRG